MIKHKTNCFLDKRIFDAANENILHPDAGKVNEDVNESQEDSDSDFEDGRFPNLRRSFNI